MHAKSTTPSDNSALSMLSLVHALASVAEGWYRLATVGTPDTFFSAMAIVNNKLQRGEPAEDAEAHAAHVASFAAHTAAQIALSVQSPQGNPASTSATMPDAPPSSPTNNNDGATVPAATVDLSGNFLFALHSPKFLTTILAAAVSVSPTSGGNVMADFGVNSKS
jgi:hypothetical protein